MPETTVASRRALPRLLAVTAVALTALALSTPASSSARLTYRACGQIPIGSVWSVSATRNVTCHKARKVVKKVMNGHMHPLGFTCRSRRIGTYEYASFCHRGDRWIKATTGV
jgi:hypothetical protein